MRMIFSMLCVVVLAACEQTATPGARTPPATAQASQGFTEEELAGLRTLLREQSKQAVTPADGTEAGDPNPADDTGDNVAPQGPVRQTRAALPQHLEQLDLHSAQCGPPPGLDRRRCPIRGVVIRNSAMPAEAACAMQHAVARGYCARDPNHPVEQTGTLPSTQWGDVPYEVVLQQ